MVESVYSPPKNIWVELEELSKQSYDEKFLTPIKNDVERLKEIFFSRYTYNNDTDWLIDVGNIVHDLCENTGNEDHHMYPKEEFIESYVTG